MTTTNLLELLAVRAAANRAALTKRLQNAQTAATAVAKLRPT
jgi:hypothetical protein